MCDASKVELPDERHLRGSSFVLSLPTELQRRRTSPAHGYEQRRCVRVGVAYAVVGRVLQLPSELAQKEKRWQLLAEDDPEYAEDVRFAPG